MEKRSSFHICSIIYIFRERERERDNKYNEMHPYISQLEMCKQSFLEKKYRRKLLNCKMKKSRLSKIGNTFRDERKYVIFNVMIKIDTKWR